MKQRLEDYPLWINRSLQGITYWIGHRRCLYRGYPLAEAALVAEVCNLIYANLDSGFVLQCEVQYTDLLAGRPRPDILTQRARVDLLVAEEADEREEPVPKFAIEVKRASAPKAQIDADLRRLAAVRKALPSVRAFLFVIAESNRPARFVTDEGTSERGAQPIPDSPGSYRVRRTWKAAHALQSIDTAQYACLVEVFAH